MSRATARPCVISLHHRPPPKVLERLMPGLVGFNWSWVFAGLQEPASTLSSSDMPDNVISAGEVGLVAGRHKALQTCHEDIIVYLDDDVSLPDGWLPKLIEPFDDPDIHFVGCRYLPDYEGSPPDWMEGLWDEQDGFRTLGYLSLLDGGHRGRVHSPMLVWGLCFAARRDTLLKLKGFHPDAYPWELRRFRGDGETGLALKAQTLGLKSYYQATTHVLHAVPAARMTPQYLERRAFLQGISDSYTEIRRTHEVPGAGDRSWKDLLRPIKRNLERKRILRSPTPVGIRLLMARAHAQGVQYHQDQVRNDPLVLQWVLKPDYFDYKLPKK